MNTVTKIGALAVIPLALASCPNPASPQALERDTDAVFSYLAKRRSMNVLRAGGEQLGTFGSVYSLLKPTTKSDLYSMAKSGRPIDITPYDPTTLGLPSFTTETTSYQIQSQLASEIGADLKAEIEGQGGNVDAFRKKLVASKIRFKVSRISTYERQARRGFSGHDYTPSELPEDSTAVLTPLEILVVTDFSYENSSDSTIEGKLVADFIENLKADIVVKRTSSTTGGVGITEPRVIAIRPLVLANKER